ncbi:hypothetical protein AAFC00_001263 [Neodothiora populina]|uniref:Uncharacterized protein n=1 Tax=Neodothiora populina TaxID=2781224 RepID=A0ABR3PPC6_9PEZI
MGALGKLLPLVVLLVIVGIAAFVGYQIYLWSNEMADRGKRHMDKKNVSFSKEGMKVGVKQVNDEEYADKTQSYLVKVWNYSSFPAYKSRLGWNSQATPSASSSGSTKPPQSRPISKSSSSAPGLNVPKETIIGSRKSVSPGAFPQ